MNPFLEHQSCLPQPWAAGCLLVECWVHPGPRHVVAAFPAGLVAGTIPRKQFSFES
uniref:Macaca fascicularis brain cDNA, clone: QccE-17211 n=1 Tax=Macaca fascicularis TaxID=9541 RepID=I7GLN7_MACFA|nr:unnamed protein product [Macaca fascicularis]